jgi:hypothetical protein
LEQDTFTVCESELASIRCKEIRNKKNDNQLFWERIDEHEEKNNMTIRQKEEGRFDLEIDHPCLKILKAQMSDSGCYYCCIDYSVSEGKKTVRSEQAYLIIRKSRHIL